jgi:endonuclease/exonuclease/phosphatase family metal-dependent hydrolase
MGAMVPGTPSRVTHDPAVTGQDPLMRIATFNILSGRSPADDEVDEDRFASAVAALDADVLGLQEVDRNQPRSRHADLTSIAAEAMAAPHHRFVAALSGTPATWTAATGEDQPDAAAYGVALLSRYPVTGWQVVRLPPVPVPVPHRFHGRWRPDWVRDEPRVGVVAEIESPTGPLRVACTHLSYLRWWNPHQLRVLMRALGDHDDVPTVLLGDLNMGRERAEQVTGMRPLATGLTFPGDEPAEQIDHLLARGELTATGGGTVALPMSDHRALVADLG